MSDIPEDVLELAEEAYQQAIYMTTSDEPKKMVQMVAGAILAERERCASIVENYTATKSRNIDSPLVRRRYPSVTSIVLAQAIRNTASTRFMTVETI